MYMKITNKLVLLLLTVSLFTGCKKEDDPVFDQSPDQRLNAALSAYQKQLVEAPNGWKAFISPKSGGTYFFYLKFNDQNRVVMFDPATGRTLKTIPRMAGLSA